MEQTDRQTDKATHWNAAVFEVDDNWSRLDAPPPSFIKEVVRKKEICPTTGKEHYQIHVVCHRQVRLTQMRSYIPKTKWTPVRGDEYIKNSIAYISKAETTAPGAKVETIQGEAYFRLHQLLQELAKYSEPETNIMLSLDVNPKRSPNGWVYITRRLLMKNICWADKLSNPTLRRMWEDWGSLFISNWEEAGSLIIEDPVPVEDWDYSFLD